MHQNEMQNRCTLLAVIAPLAHFARVGYMATLLAAGAMLPLTILAGNGLKRITKTEAALELIWIGLVLGALMGYSGRNWPGRKSEIVVPLALLALAWISGNREKSHRVCSTLFWIGAVPAVLTIVSMIGTVELKHLEPEPGSWTGGLIVSLLLPALNGAEKGNGIRTAAVTAVAATILGTMIQGGLGIQGAGTVESPLYELGRCVGNGGFEIIVSVVLTLGWYGFAAMGMDVTESVGKILSLSEGQSRTAVAVIAGLIILFNIRIEDWVLISGCLILWILIPLLHPKK